MTKNQNVPKWFKPFAGLIKEFSGDLASYVDIIQSKISVQDNAINILADEKDRLNREILNLQHETDDMQQYSRRTCLLIHGIKENKDENCENVVNDILENKQEAGLVPNDVARTHRLGKLKEGNRPRPIIVRFLSYRQRAKVFSLKKKLKGTRTMISENLTSKRYKLLQRCYDEFDKRNVWTFDGRVNVKLGDGSKKVFTNDDELSYFLAAI